MGEFGKHTIVKRDLKSLNPTVLRRLIKNGHALYRMRQCPICAGKLIAPRCGFGVPIEFDGASRMLALRGLKRPRRSSETRYLCTVCNVFWRLAVRVSMQMLSPHGVSPGSTTLELIGVNNCYCRRSVWEGGGAFLPDGPPSLVLYHRERPIHSTQLEPLRSVIPSGVRLVGPDEGGEG